MLDKTLVARADVLASLASQGGRRSEAARERRRFLTFPNSLQVLAPGGLIGGAASSGGRADKALVGDYGRAVSLFGPSQSS